METNNKMYGGVPVAIICLIMCYAPNFCYISRWQDAVDGDPIKFAVQSQLFRYSLVASLAASIPPLLDLLYHIITIDTVVYNKSTNKYFSALTVLFSLIVPELMMLIFVTPKGNTRLFLCIYDSQLILSMLSTSQFLYHYEKKYWRNKLFTAAVCLIYIGSSFQSLGPYFPSDLRMLAHYIGFLIQAIGVTVFLMLSYKYLTRPGDGKTSEGSTVDSVDGESFSKYVLYCMLFVINGLVFLDFGVKLEYWTHYDSTVLVYIVFLLTVPTLSMCMILTQATRNQVYFTQKIKVMFVRYISHEMRTPLNTAAMGLQYLRSELVKANTNIDLVDILDQVRGACEISITILNEMLDFDKLQSGLMKLEVEEIPVRDFLHTVIAPFHVYARQKDIQLVCEVNKPELDSLLINADRNKFAQVIRNLISNALKFTPSEGSVTVMATVVTKTIPKTNNGADNRIAGESCVLKIDVIDTGVGVSKVNQSKLFKEIVQFSPGKLQSGGGSGLGLYISKGIMDLHHGSLCIASEGEGFGCTFTAEIEASYTGGYLTQSQSLDEYKDRDDTKGTQGPLRRLSSLTNMVSTVRQYRTFSPSRSFSTVLTSTKKISHVCVDTELDVNDFAIPQPLFSPPPPPPSSGALLQPSTTSTIKASDFALCQSFSDSETESVTDPVLLKVLVVDDSVSNRKMLVRLVRDKCSVIVEAVDGLDAVGKMRLAMRPPGSEGRLATPLPASSSASLPFDAVLMDYVMPNMEGPEAARCMRELGYTGLIIGITGNVLPSDKERFTSQGADIVLTKPVDIRDINNAFQTTWRKFHSDNLARITHARK